MQEQGVEEKRESNTVKIHAQARKATHTSDDDDHPWSQGREMDTITISL